MGSGPNLFTNFQLEAEAELWRHPQLTWTLIRVGIVLDHLTMPQNPKKTYVSPFWVFIDIDHEQCVFPGDGSQLLVLTHITDVAAYIERLVGLSSKDWPRESLIASNRLEVRNLEPVAKKITGKQPNMQWSTFKSLILMIGKNFKVTYDSVEAIRKGHIRHLLSNRAVFEELAKGEMFCEVEQQVMLSLLSNAHDLPGKDLAELFPFVQTTKIEGVFRAGWTLKQETVP